MITLIIVSTASLFVAYRTYLYLKTPYKIVQMDNGKYKVREPNWFLGSSYAGTGYSPDHINYDYEWSDIKSAEEYIEDCKDAKPVSVVKIIENK